MHFLVQLTTTSAAAGLRRARAAAGWTRATAATRLIAASIAGSCALGAGCDKDETPEPEPAKAANQVDAAAPTATSQTSQLAEPLKVSITVPDVGPGVEGTRCVKVRLGNDKDLKIGKIHNILEGHTHHFVLSAVDDPDETEAPLFECPPFRAPLVGAPLTITQKPEEVVQMPEGVGYPLRADALMHLELHYINTSTETQDVTASAELYPIADSGAEKEIQEAGFLIVGNLSIKIPPKSKHSTGDLFVQPPAELADAHYYAFTGHTHRFGTNVTVGVSKSKEADIDWVYKPANYDWSAPDVVYLDPPLQLQGDSGFHLQCDWDNPTDSTITYGESALTEMCFFWAYYYPRQPEQKVVLAGVQDSIYRDGGMARE